MKRYRSQAIRTALVQDIHRRAAGAVHWLAHKTRHNYGHVETFWHEDTLMVGFRCNCGRLLDVAPCRRIWPE